jgi:predicted RNA-binding Zn ribbon-like protein
LVAPRQVRAIIERPPGLRAPVKWLLLVQGYGIDLLVSRAERTEMAETLPFKFVGGDPAIDLVNTVDWTSRGLENERLGDYERLTRWAEEAGVVSSRAAAALRKRAAAHPREAETAYRSALRARELLARLFGEIATGGASAQALEGFNRLLRPALEHFGVVRSARNRAPRLQLGWEGLDRSLASVLWPVLWSAASLIASDEASRIRVCGGEDCGWLYVDRSRNRLRRWCQMETCGTREKTRRRRSGATR